MQLRFLLAAISAAIGLFFAWRVLGALRSGHASLFVHFGPVSQYSRRSNPGNFVLDSLKVLNLARVHSNGGVLRRAVPAKSLELGCCWILQIVLAHEFEADPVGLAPCNRRRIGDAFA